MTRSVTLFLALLVAFAHSSVPNWVQEEWRTLHYPSAEFYTGFSQDNIEGIPSRDDFLAVEKSAQNRLSESIVVRVQSNTAIKSKSTQKQRGKDVTETNERIYNQAIKTESGAVLAKVETKYYFDENSGNIYAFSFVRKSDLSAYYASQINAIFVKSENLIMQAEQAKGTDKNLAKSKLFDAEKELNEISPFQKFLQTVDFEAGENKMQNGRKQKLFSKILNMRTELEKKAGVYLTADNSYIADNLPGIISDSDCECEVLENEYNADFMLNANGKIDRCIESSGRVFCYASGQLIIYNSATKKNQKFGFSGVKEGWSNRAMAEERALKSLNAEMKNKIVEYINGK